MIMEPFPQSMEHQERMKLASVIAERLMRRYGESVKAVGLYGSLARGEDGPCSDLITPFISLQSKIGRMT